MFSKSARTVTEIAIGVLLVACAASLWIAYAASRERAAADLVDYCSEPATDPFKYKVGCIGYQYRNK